MDTAKCSTWKSSKNTTLASLLMAPGSLSTCVELTINWLPRVYIHRSRTESPDIATVISLSIPIWYTCSVRAAWTGIMGAVVRWQMKRPKEFQIENVTTALGRSGKGRRRKKIIKSQRRKNRMKIMRKTNKWAMRHAKGGKWILQKRKKWSWVLKGSKSQRKEVKRSRHPVRKNNRIVMKSWKAFKKVNKSMGTCRVIRTDLIRFMNS